VDVFLRRRFTESENDPASTSVGVQVRLLTLGTSDEPEGLFGTSTFADFRDSLSAGTPDTDFRSRVLGGADR
jgi:hypothetical protein